MVDMFSPCEGNPYCEDLATTGPMLNLLRDSLNNQSIASCADVLPFCDSISKMPEWEVDGGQGSWRTTDGEMYIFGVFSKLVNTSFREPSDIPLIFWFNFGE